MSTQNELKQAAARAAIRFVKSGEIIGVGTGSTVDYFIDELAELAPKIAGAVPTSERSAIRLAHNGIALVDLNDIESLSLYVDGADEVDQHLSMIKGGGGALTREKIVAAVAQTFVCIVDASKRVDVLGAFPLPVEVIPMARTYVMRELTRYGTPKVRSDFITDNGNIIIDVHGLQIRDPLKLEQSIERIVGVVSCGLFAARGADVLLLATDAGVVEFRQPDRAAARSQCHPEL